MDDNRAEACGRCSMTAVVSVTNEDDEASGHNPFDGARIEVAESELRTATAPQRLFGRLKRRLDDAATRLIYG